MLDDPTKFYAIARNMAADLLRFSTSRTLEAIRDAAEKGAMAVRSLGHEIPVDVLNAELRHMFSVEIEDATILEDDDLKGHVPWLAGRKAGISFRFWRRYMTYLERDSGISPTAVNATDALTDLILGHLEDPLRDGPWDRRGMVVGSVQSGKTANYTGLVCKAIDSGYKLVIILAGIRQQPPLPDATAYRRRRARLRHTKSRRLNKDSQSIGVGRLPGEYPPHPLSDQQRRGRRFQQTRRGDHRHHDRRRPRRSRGEENSRLLANLLKWVLHVAGKENAQTGKRSIRDVPLLLIDDEADNASIDTGKKKGTPADADTVTAINGRIESFLPRSRRLPTWVTRRRRSPTSS